MYLILFNGQRPYRTDEYQNSNVITKTITRSDTSHVPKVNCPTTYRLFVPDACEGWTASGGEVRHNHPRLPSKQCHEENPTTPPLPIMHLISSCIKSTFVLIRASGRIESSDRLYR
ncbi:hypothetical protein EVAR_78584_1 [Eumeta japonica]|uniref:Uncharacterized protein n=1 Tax=Eumeta variegata TaxID=151549 RepID=A0A4C1W7L6_EUMVA|nr:hypothetical protein EVAR_78584_1 [Eumeta japonica]